METLTHKLADYYTAPASATVCLQCACGHSTHGYMGIVRTYDEAAEMAEAKMLEHLGTDTLEDDEED